MASTSSLGNCSSIVLFSVSSSFILFSNSIKSSKCYPIFKSMFRPDRQRSGFTVYRIKAMPVRRFRVIIFPHMIPPSNIISARIIKANILKILTPGRFSGGHPRKHFIITMRTNGLLFFLFHFQNLYN